jgi:hypothetical protein
MPHRSHNSDSSQSLCAHWYEKIVPVLRGHGEIWC